MGTVAEGVDSIRDPGIGAPAAGAARSSQDGPVAATPRRADDPRMLRAALVVGDFVVVAGAWALGGF
ncbi:MAG TPA: hypothetical protein VMB72_12530, partial [Acidimicrobiales bacterium]|nr:hypothetical protein [Acidimicrobiales bacterium]